MRPKNKWQTIVLLVALCVVVLACVIAVGTALHHQPFNSQKWKSDVKTRYDMDLSDLKGLNKEKILAMLGNPEKYGKDKNSDSETFIYLMPSTAEKGIYAISFKKALVTNTLYDDSGELSYPAH